jgi:hypothetical protein
MQKGKNTETDAGGVNFGIRGSGGKYHLRGGRGWILDRYKDPGKIS